MAIEIEVLFVDDEESIRLTLPLMLKEYGFKVTAAGTVSEALRLMSEHRFDVLISDMNIERGGDGFVVASAMRSTNPQAVRLILTGYPAIETALQALRAEVDDYLIKPTEVEDIVSTIRSKLENRAGRKQLTQKSLGEIINQEQEYITAKWLELAKQDADLSSIALSDDQRKNHLPGLLDIAVRIIEGKAITAEQRRIARQHGGTRFKQGYSAKWLLREAKILEEAIADCIQRNLLEIQITNLIPDVANVFGIVHDVLEESMSELLELQERQRGGSRKSSKSG
jgi:DNA-binding response OmpR family regulator